MPMVLRVRDKATADRVWKAMWARLDQSRFAVNGLTTRQAGHRESAPWEVVVGESEGFFGGILLREKKENCGNHPGPCPVRVGGPRPHRHAKFLEGLDWVALNDMVNDVLDELGVETLKAGTSVVEIRRGRERRTTYGSHFLGATAFQGWDKVGLPHEYEDYCGRAAPRSDYPSGTPGEPHWEAARPVPAVA